MLEDPQAQAIISRARQKNVAAAQRSGRDFDRIFADFFPGRRVPGGFSGQRAIDLGPGQFDFARIICACGGACDSIDDDPAVVELGRYLDLPVTRGDLRTFDFRGLAGRYDGLFSKFSLNAYWLDGAGLAERIAAIDDMLRPDGWGWVAPWNGRPGTLADDALARGLLDAQARAFAGRGWRVIRLEPEQAAWYGLSGRVDNHVIFVRNLAVPGGLQS